MDVHLVLATESDFSIYLSSVVERVGLDKEKKQNTKA